MAKKNRLTRLLSLLMALVMLLSLFSAHTFATEKGASLTEEPSTAPMEDALPEEKTATKATSYYSGLLESLPPVVPINQLVDLTGYKFDSTSTYDCIQGLNGLFYFVSQKTVDGKLTYFLMDPSTPTIYGKVAATPVTIQDDRVYGADPKMAFEVIHDTTTVGDALWEHRLKLHGDYDKLSEAYYLSPGYNTKTGISYLERGTSATLLDYGLVLREGPGETERQSLGFYRNVKPSHFGGTSNDGIPSYIQYGADADGNRYFEMAPMPSSFGEGHLFKAYRLSTDRVNVENLYEMLLSVKPELTYNSLYSAETHAAFLSAFEEAVELYTTYNGKDLTEDELSNIDALQEQVDAMTLKLMGYRSQLRISTQGNQGRQIKYRGATLYNWNEDEMNRLTKDLDNGSKRGLYFTSGKNRGQNIPDFSKWNPDKIFENISGLDHALQNFAISSGLVRQELGTSLDPLNPEVAVSGDLWGIDDIEGVKSVYTDVQLPFIYDVETGYYVLNSDTNAVYFADEPESDATLSIADLPTAYNVPGSGTQTVEDPATYDSEDPTTHKLYDRYVTGFQPFAKITDKVWKGFPGDTPAEGGSSALRPSYLQEGISQTGTFVPEPHDMGTSSWGFGMLMEFSFRITEDGTVIDQNGNEKPIIFEFSGDDDVWVYIDGKLAIDIGGTHDAIQGQIDFQTGNVVIRSDKYGRITDLSEVYNQNSDFTDYTYSPEGTSVIGHIYEPNFYTGKVGSETADSVKEQRLATLADGREHTLRIYYMERGRGRTNCYIRFNLPQPDTLTVEKEINPYYNGNESTPLGADLLNNLQKKVYGFFLTENGEPVANMLYYLTKNGAQVGLGKTNGDGYFTLRGDQIAEFRCLDFASTKTYAVAEEELDPDYWAEESYAYAYSGTGNADGHSATGNAYAASAGDTYISETLSFVCTNVYCYNLRRDMILDPEPQAVVLDYGKPIDVEVVRNAVVTGASEIWVRDSKLLSVSYATAADQSYGKEILLLDTDADGDMDSFRFTLSKMLDKVVTVNAEINVPFEDGSWHTVSLPVHLVPATQMYYETDFAEGVFDLHLKAEGTDNHWQSVGTPQEEVQDNGNVGDQLYDFKIDKDSIPSNVFFADFDGTGAEKRYNKHLLYNGLDFDKVASNGRAVNWVTNTNNMNLPTIDQKAGFLVLTMKNADKRPYIQTGIHLAEHFQLKFHPEENQYLQLRMRLKDFVLREGQTHPLLKFYFYTGVNKGTDAEGVVHYTSNGDLAELATIAVQKDLDAELLNSGEFFTLTLPLTDKFTNADLATAFRITIDNIESKDADHLGAVIIDYLYVGRLTDRDGLQDMDHESGAAAMLFDFKNDASAALRYTGAQYQKNQQNINYDTQSRWAVYGATDNGKDSGYSMNTTAGVINVPVGNATVKDSNNKDRYGPYLYMTNSSGEGITYTENSEPDWLLNYKVPSGRLYFHVRFKVSGSAFDPLETGDQNPYVQCTIAGYDSAGKRIDDHPRLHYDKAYASNGKDVVGVVEITKNIQKLDFASIQNIYVRFVHLHQSATNKKGQIQVDYIYVGPESDPAKVRSMQEETAVFIDFNNTDLDKQRYSGTMYSGVNYDIKENWINDWFDLENIGSGFMKLTPKRQAEHESGYGSVYPKPKESSKLNYTLTGNDHIQMRVRFVNVTQHGTKAPNAKVFFGPEDAPFTSAGQVEGYDYNANQKFWSLNKEDVESGKWITLTFDLAEHTWVNGRPDTIRFLFPGFQQIKIEDGGYILIDYLYLGPKVDANPTCDSLFFGFENEEIDQLRYESDTYSGRNYDLHGESSWTSDPEVSSSAYSYTVDNEMGILTLEVTNKFSTESIRGPYLTTSDLYDLAENRSANQYTVRFKPENAEYMQLRFRTNDCEKSDNAERNMNVVFLYDGYDKDGTYVDFNTYNNGAYIRGYYEIKDGFQTLTMPLTDAIREMTLISNFGIRFQHMSSDVGGTVDIDYIYVGPGELAPDPVYGHDSSYEDGDHSHDALFFGFDNEEGDRQRYEASVYGGLNYDLCDSAKSVGYWATSSVTNASAGADKCKDYSIDADTGLLHLNVRDGKTGGDSGNPGPYLITTHKYNSYGFDKAHRTLHYSTDNAEIAQIRFKVTGCDIGKNPSIIFLEGGLDENGSYRDYNDTASDGKTHQMREFFDVTGDWQVIRCDVNENIHIIKELTNFGVRFVGFSGSDPEKDYIEIDYLYIGPEELAPAAENGSTLPELSNGSSYFVEGAGVKTATNTKSYTEASFTFTGTGFDLISRTGREQATIRVEVQDATTGTVFKAMTVNNKGEMELSQIPVVSIHGLPHGTYKVFIWVNKAVTTTLPILNRGGQFFFDAVRIYDPVDVSKEEGFLTTQQKISLDAYGSDKEAHDYVKEIRDILLSVADFSAVTFGNSTTGALFVDSEELTAPVKPEGTVPNPSEPVPTETVDMVTDHLALTVRDYNKVGPKNEVYLSPGEAVVFKLVMSAAQKPVSIDIGAKTILTDCGTLAAGFVKAPDTSADTLDVLTRIEEKLVTSTGMYYDLDVSTLPASGDVYLVIYNAYEGTDKTRNILSITDLKVAYKEAPTEALPEDDNTGTGDTEIKPEKRSAAVLEEPYSFAVDGRTLEAAAVFINAVIESRKSETPIVHDGTKLRHSLNLASDIAMNYLVAKEELAGYENVSLEVLIPVYDSNGEMTHRLQTLLPEDKGTDYYYFTLNGLTAVNMNDTITATLYMEKDGRTYCSEADVYSISDYAYSQLNNPIASKKLKTLCAELLRYGAYAQTYKGYRTDALADKEMTPDHRAYLSDMESVTFGNTNTVLEDLSNAPILWKGKALSLESKVCLKFVFAPGSYTGDPTALCLRVSYRDGNGSDKTLEITGAELYNDKKGYYAFTLDVLNASELRTVISARIYEGQTPLSCTLQYSADTYGNGKNGTLLSLCKALFAYSDSAKAYFQ